MHTVQYYYSRVSDTTLLVVQYYVRVVLLSDLNIVYILYVQYYLCITHYLSTRMFLLQSIIIIFLYVILL